MLSRANALKTTGKVNALAQPTGFGVASDEAGVTGTPIAAGVLLSDAPMTMS